MDIDTARDTRLFLDPYLLAISDDPWSQDASVTIKNFFNAFLGLLYSGDQQHARELFDYLHEPNETCLGLSRRKPKGRGVGEGDAERIFDSLASSRAAQTGLLHDLEDTRIFVRGVDRDKASDMTTNIIRKHLIDYTVDQANLWNIPLRENAPSGDWWNAETRQWEQSLEKNLYVGDRRILLIPKSVVSYCKKYSPKQFHQHFVLNFMQSEHLRLGTNLVQTRRRKKNREEIRFVTKKSIIRSGEGIYDKDLMANFTLAHQKVFQDFKVAQRTKEASIPLADFLDVSVPEVCEHLIQKLGNVPTGREHASEYQRVVISILDFLLYPKLTKPRMEEAIHEGRKRIDITFDNGAGAGFFFTLAHHSQVPCRYIFFECKNYGSEIANPELDQISGRFSVNTSKFGVIVCRSLRNHDLFLQRCRDTLQAQRGVVLPLVDDDLTAALQARSEGRDSFLEERFEELYRRVALTGI